ncbi:MAG: PASTA domain-containing protein [Clostridia bacterium]|nr:PASTA domain-containing protein [Clostridia bacterium]
MTDGNRDKPARISPVTVVGILMLAGFIAVLARVLYLQTARFDDYGRRVSSQMTRDYEVEPIRGDILDADGLTLATNIITYRVFVSPKAVATAQNSLLENALDNEVRDLSREISEGLGEILGVDPEEIRTQLALTSYQDRTIKKGVDEDTAQAVREFIARNEFTQMIYLEATATRHYPYDSLASHILGFTSAAGNGVYGLEYQYEEELAGTAGRYVIAKDAQGNGMPFEYEKYIEAKDGYDIRTTIKVEVQRILEEQVEKAYLESGGQNRATGIVMDVNTGAVLGLAVYPYFNLNEPNELTGDFKDKLDKAGLEEGSEEYQTLKNELLLSMWSNKAITEGYIPGSTFKVITSAVALEEKLFDLNAEFYCKGYMTVNAADIHCAEIYGHGHLTFAEAIQVSCNPSLMTMGLKIGAPRFYNYFKAFGYLEKTGIDLPGEQLSPSWFWNYDTFSSREIYLATASFGQNFNVTAIQQITGICAVANGGYLVTPHLLDRVTDPEGNTVYAFDKTAGVRRQVLTSDICATISEILREGVAGNGGGKNTYVAGYRVAAKTGTSEKKDHEGYYVCSTVAYAPSDDPQYAMILIVDEPTKGVLYGSYAAAPYIANAFKEILPYLGVEAVYSEKELDKLSVTVPSVTYWSLDQAMGMCENLGYEIAVVGNGSLVTAQLPQGGAEIESNGKRIVLYTKGTPAEDIMVPNLVGMTATAAYKTVQNLGLNVRIEGAKNYLTGTEAVVIDQSPAYGTYLASGDVVTLTFRYNEEE